MRLTTRGKIVILSLLVTGAVLIAILSIFTARSIMIDDYSEIDPHTPTCVEGTILQPDGSCVNQEVTS